jgi:predicted ATPase/DNA-binding winged helix-turn-helix (wHTH) protein
LVERPGTVVTKSELIARVWPNTFVEEGNLKVNMAALRRTLGDGGQNDARYIATVTGQGYRFIAPVANGAAFESASTDAGATTRQHNLPTGTTRILGRADAIDAIRRDLEVSRLVTIVGPGGIGKTTVALAVAEHALGSFRDGVWLVDLALLKEPSHAPSAIATAIGLPGAAGNSLATLCESLRDREMLLVLDSCEHIIEAAAACTSRVLADAARVKVLVTSREPLELSGERVRRLCGLSTPAASTSLNAEEALTYPAIQLFVDRASDRFEWFKLSDADAPAVAEICRRLDGLALAIEFAATRVDAFGVRGLLRQLDDRFRLLIGRRSGPERHRTLMATLDWSYSLLSPGEAALLRAVSVFSGALSLDGAVTVSCLPSRDAADALAHLATKSLLAVDVDGDDIAYRMLETTRAYSLEQLHVSGQEEVIRQRHAEHVCMVLERATAEWAGRPAREWEVAYRDVLGDLRTALDWTEQDPVNRLLLIRLTVAAGLFWNHFSLNEECRIHTTRAIEALDAAGLAGTITEMRLLESLAGAIICTRGLLPEATNAARRALDLAVQMGDTDHHLRCLHIIGMNELVGGQLDAGMRTLKVLTTVAAEKDISAVRTGEVHMAMGELFVGRLGRARRRIEELQISLPTDIDDSHVGRFLWDIEVVGGMVLSNVQWLSGFPDTGARTGLAAVERARRTRHELSVSNALAWTCPIFFWSGLYEECRRCVAMLDEQSMRHGIIAWRPVTRFYRGALACAMGDDHSRGLDEIQDALAEFRAMNHMVRFPYYLGVLADELAKRSRLVEAEETILAALAAAAAQNERWCVPELLRIRASILSAESQRDRAETLLLKSIAAAEEINALSWRLRTANDLWTLWRDAIRADDVRKVLLPIYGEFTEGFATRDLVVAANLLDSPARPGMAKPPSLVIENGTF